jgi:hypothetical protein
LLHLAEGAGDGETNLSTIRSSELGNEMSVPGLTNLG